MAGLKSRSVGVVVTNNERDLFYIQQKDELHPIPEFRLFFTFFGGQLKKNEEEKIALKRELLEELEQNAAILIYDESKKMFDSGLMQWEKGVCEFSLYEAALPTEKLMHISKLPIREGKQGCLITSIGGSSPKLR